MNGKPSFEEVFAPDAPVYARYKHLLDKKWVHKTSGVSTPAIQLIRSIRALKNCSFEVACKTLDKGVKDGIYASGGYLLWDL